MPDIGFYEKQGMPLHAFHDLMIEEWCRCCAIYYNNKLLEEGIIEEMKSGEFYRNRNLQMSPFYRNWANTMLKEVQV